MVNFKKIIHIYRKEMLDLLRDKRTVITSIVVPILLYPLLMVGFSSLAMRQETKLEQKYVNIHLQDNVNSKLSVRIRNEITKIENLNVITHTDSVMSLLEEDIIQAAVTIRDSLSTAGFPILIVTVSYNETEDLSSIAFKRIKGKLDGLESELVGERLEALSIKRDILNAIDLKEENVAPPEKMLGFMVGRILPYLLIVITLSGSAVVASDLVAGEKERGTLETILVSAAKRIELIIGKYITIMTFSLITVFLNLFSMFISIRHILGQSGIDTAGIQLPLSNFALVLLAMLPLITLVAAVLLSLSTYARNIKEAQSYQMPLVIGGMILAMISLLPGFELTPGFALIPIVNFSLLFKEIMIGGVSFMQFLIVFASTLILDIIAILISIKLFNNEAVLFRTSEDNSLKFWGKNKSNIFKPQIVTLFFILVLLALFYLGNHWQSKELLSGLIKTQIFLILLPTILVLRISRVELKSVIGLRPIRTVNILLIMLMAIPVMISATIVGQLINLIYPISESYLEGMNNLLTVQDGNFISLLIIIALLPALCEETMFRGYILNAFRKRGYWSAIVISGILFGILHLDMFRLIPVTLLGIYLGYLTLRAGSIYAAMIAHFLNNGLALIMVNYNDKIPFLAKLVYQEKFHFWLIIPTLLLLFIFLKVFDKINPIKKFELGG